MNRTPATTGYARLAPGQARAVLAALALTAAGGVAVTLSSLASSNAGEKRTREGDVQLYRAKVDRVHAGEPYYPVAGDEMRRRGYPTRSVFNWRLPTPFWVMGWMPAVVLGKGLVCGLGVALLLMAFEAVARERNNAVRQPLACALLLTGPLLPCLLDDLFVMPVLWAGILIALSVCAYGVGRPRLGVAFGLAAVFLRELAMPYCLVATALAWRKRRWGELLAWTVGLAAFGCLFAWHWWQVNALIQPGDRAHQESWVQLGGAGFVISTAQMNAYLVLLPQWITALYLVAALVGFAGWNTELGLRAGLSGCLFVILFAVVGQPFNQYWGSLIAPLLCFPVARFPASVWDLWKAAAFARPGLPRPC